MYWKVVSSCIAETLVIVWPTASVYAIAPVAVHFSAGHYQLPSFIPFLLLPLHPLGSQLLYCLPTSLRLLLFLLFLFQMLLRLSGFLFVSPASFRWSFLIWFRPTICQQIRYQKSQTEIDRDRSCHDLENLP
jgi:hypothetical protein